MSTQAKSPVADAAASSIATKYLTFLLGRESYGIEVLKVREIIRLTDITPVPQMPQHVKGVINLRGKIIPVIDLKEKFGMAACTHTERTCIVVVQVARTNASRIPMGLLVDDVEEVCSVAPNDIEPTPDFGTAVDVRYLLGIAKSKGTVKTLLDIDQLVLGEAQMLASPAAATT